MRIYASLVSYTPLATCPVFGREGLARGRKIVAKTGLRSGGDAVDVMLAAGDVVVCPSEMEHRVGAVSSGTRASLNVDFWDVDAAADRRSDFDRY